MDFSSIANFFDNNASFLLPVSNAVLGAFGANQQSNNRSRMLDTAEQAIMNQYNRDLAQEQADAQYQSEMAGWSARNRAAASAAAAANRMAAMRAAEQTRANQMRARKQGDKVQTDAMRERLQLFSPMKDSALRLLPQMEGAYSQGNAALRQLGANLLTPQGIENTFAPQLSVNQRIPLSSLLQGGR